MARVKTTVLPDTLTPSMAATCCVMSIPSSVVLIENAEPAGVDVSLSALAEVNVKVTPSSAKADNVVVDSAGRRVCAWLRPPDSVNAAVSVSRATAANRHQSQKREGRRLAEPRFPKSLIKG